MSTALPLPALPTEVHRRSASVAALRTARTVYVLCPAGQVTGGPELLHQLVHQLVRLGRDARIVYIPEGPALTPAAYRGYGCPVADHTVDAPGNVVIVPETLTSELERFVHAQPVIWWLSVDNYSGNFASFVLTRMWLRRRLSAAGADRPGIIDLCQSHYAVEFVRKRFGRPAYLLSDHLNDDFMQWRESAGAQRDDVVLYNPKKDSVFGKLLRLWSRDTRFVPLIDMSREQVIDTLRRSKVYIDFGFHPGKDRIPREAAMCGCAVVVVRRGAACNSVDVPLPERFKIASTLSKLRQARALLRECIDQRDAVLRAQADYRATIEVERAGFLQQVSELFMAPAHVATATQAA